MKNDGKMVGLFIATYEIGGNMPGAPLCKLHLTVNTPSESVHGVGKITQAINPPLDISTKVDGTFSYMCTMSNCTILVVATGYPIVKWPSSAGVGPVIPPNFDLRMVLEDDWKSGTANYKYMDADGNWHSIENAPVKLVDADTL